MLVVLIVLYAIIRNIVLAACHWCLLLYACLW